MSKEKRLNEIRHELVAADSESTAMRAEIAALNQRLGEIMSEPLDVRQGAEKIEFISSLSMRIGELEGRHHVLEQRRHELQSRLRLEMDNLELALQYRAGRTHLSRAADGSVRRVIVRDAGPVRIPSQRHQIPDTAPRLAEDKEGSARE